MIGLGDIVAIHTNKCSLLYAGKLLHNYNVGTVVEVDNSYKNKEPIAKIMLSDGTLQDVSIFFLKKI